MSQIPQMYLDNSSVAYLQDIDPFFLSLIIKGRTLKNCMIDSGASNNIMPFKVMQALGLGVDTRQGKCREMDAREVPIIGTINALPFRLVKKKVSSTIQTLSPLDVNIKNTTYDPIDMVSMLSQIIVKVPLAEMFRIEEHKRKALSWLGGI